MKVKIVKEVKRSDGLWRFACGDVFLLTPSLNSTLNLISGNLDILSGNILRKFSCEDCFSSLNISSHCPNWVALVWPRCRAMQNPLPDHKHCFASYLGNLDNPIKTFHPAPASLKMTHVGFDRNRPCCTVSEAMSLSTVWFAGNPQFSWSQASWKTSVFSSIFYSLGLSLLMLSVFFICFHRLPPWTACIIALVAFVWTLHILLMGRFEFASTPHFCSSQTSWKTRTPGRIVSW